MATVVLPASTTPKTCACGTPILPYELANGMTYYASACACCIERERQREAEADEAEQFDRLGYQRRYANADFDNLSDPKPAEHKIEAVRFYAQEVASEPQPSGKGLYLWGPNGTGKTHLAVAVSRTVKGSLFLNTLRLFDKLKESYQTSEVCRTFEQARSARLLVLDDLGSERPTGWVQERFYALLNTRWDEMLPTVVTSNLSPAALQEAIGAASCSRILGTCLTVLIDGPDHRRFASANI
jgi:DNA replication protein DnaC